MAWTFTLVNYHTDGGSEILANQSLSSWIVSSPGIYMLFIRIPGPGFTGISESWFTNS